MHRLFREADMPGFLQRLHSAQPSPTFPSFCVYHPAYPRAYLKLADVHAARGSSLNSGLLRQAAVRARRHAIRLLAPLRAAGDRVASGGVRAGLTQHSRAAATPSGLPPSKASPRCFDSTRAEALFPSSLNKPVVA